MRSMPDWKRVGSPRNLLTRKPAINAASGRIEHGPCFPRSCAITPPRSMSPIRMTGARRRPARSPCWRCSLARKLDLGGATCKPSNQHDVVPLPFSRSKLAMTEGSSAGFMDLELPRRCIAGHLPQPTTNLRASVALWLEQHRVHVHRGNDLAGAGLKRLRAADFAAIGGDRRVVGHVLWLERSNPHPPIGQRPAEAGNDQGFAGQSGAGALKHQGLGRPGRIVHQNSMPGCAFHAGREMMLYQRHYTKRLQELLSAGRRGAAVELFMTFVGLPAEGGPRDAEGAGLAVVRGRRTNARLRQHRP